MKIGKMKKRIRKSEIDKTTVRKGITELKRIEKKQLLRLEILKTFHQQGSLKDICETAVSLIKEYLDCDVVALRLKQGEDYPYFINKGFPKEFIESESYLCVHDEKRNILRDSYGRPILACMCGIIINAESNQDKPFFSKGGSFWSNSTTDLLASTTNEDRGAITRNVCNQYGYESVALIPIQSINYNVGLMQINDKRRNLFSLDIIELLEELGHIIGIAVERKKTEEALRISEQKFKDLTETTTDWVWEVDKDGAYTYASPKVKELLGYEVSEVLGKNPVDFMPEEEAKKIGKFFKEKLIKKTPFYGLENINRHKDGHLVILETNGIPIFDEKGNIKGYRGIDRDITERKKVEEILRRDKQSFEKLVNERTEKLSGVQRELEKARRLSDLGTLAATVAHELRNPLGVMQTAAYNIRRKGQNPSLDKHLANIEKKIAESNQIINNLLFYSRIKMPNYENINIFDILNECVSSAKERFRKHKSSVMKQYKAIRNIFIEADSLQMNELFTNIINNAFDALAGKKGKIEIKAECDNNERIIIYFKDSGIGFDKENLKMAYEPFFTTKSKGTGLGLTVCYQIVSLHDGKIDIESKKDKGTRVSVILPIKRKK